MRRSSTTSRSRWAALGLGLTAGLLATHGSAEARGRHHRVFAHHVHASAGGTAAPAQANSSAFASLVVDANSGRTLYAVNENELRHPASITKVMTLFLLFEKLDKGEISLSTQIPVSVHAASQSPTKLGLRPGATISVDNAIKAIVTRSANDMAVAVAEAVGGDEDTFARLMTRKAHALGMSRTTYVNASGLPDNRQITTARDLALLGRAIQDRFPTYYKFFSTTSFTYAGQVIANHNHLMSRVEGMDGIKTGYTNASGFNLLSNVRRDGHHIVAVVMGGRSAAGRDHIMEGLIAGHLEEAAPTRTVAAIEERPTETASATVDSDDTEPGASDNHDTSPGPAGPAATPGPSLIAPTLAVPPSPRMADRLAERPPAPLTRVALAETDKPRPAFVTGATRVLDPERLPPPISSSDRKRIVLDGSTNGRMTGPGASAVALATATPSTLRWTPGAQAAERAAVLPPPRPPAVIKTAAIDREETASIRKAVEPRSTRAAAREVEDAPTPGGSWTIQIGATENADEAGTLLSRAKSQGHGALASAKPVTEKIQKGSATLYRARFAGLGPDQAETACRTLKRSGFACFTVRN